MSVDSCGEPTFDVFARVRGPRPKVQGRRSQIEMMIHVLDSVRNGADRPTQVMYKSNLSWTICQSFLGRLSERGFLKIVSDGPRRRYKLTPTGLEVLSSFTRVAEAMAPAAPLPR
ncbi:MAG: hypothetical protein JRM99_05575 [Nitrososphaerota archaeon]|nr:hypothetical protein [Nitrososphaerota archaeon]